jgi:hypothetical protein
MWMQHRDGGLAALLYGPCTATTVINETRVELQEKTDYPFEHRIEVIVNPERKIRFTLHFRNPQWSSKTELTCTGAHIIRDNDFWRVSKLWEAGDKISLSFIAEVRQVAAANGETAAQYGPLLFALPVADGKTVVKKYTASGFEDTYLEPSRGIPDKLAFESRSSSAGFGFEPLRTHQQPIARHSFDEPAIRLHGDMISIAKGERVPVTLVPLGNASRLRRVTFPVVPEQRNM